MKIFLKIVDNCSMILMSLGAIVGISNVIGRYVFRKAFIWGDEACIYLFIWMLFVTLSLITYEDNHLNSNVIELLISKEKIETVKKYINIMIKILTLIISLFIVVLGVIPVKTAFMYQRYSDSGTFPMGLIFLSLPVGFLLNSITAL